VRVLVAFVAPGGRLRLGQLTFQLVDALFGIVGIHHQMVPPSTAVA